MTYHIDATPPPADDSPDWPKACTHAPPGYVQLGYLAWHAMAERRTANGEQSALCRACQCWRWETTPCPEATGTPKPRK